MLYIDPVVVVIGTIAFAEFVVELRGGSWVSPYSGGSSLSLLGRGMGSHRSSVGPSLGQGRGAAAVCCLGLWVRCVEGVAGAIHIPAGDKFDDGSAPCKGLLI